MRKRRSGMTYKLTVRDLIEAARDYCVSGTVGQAFDAATRAVEADREFDLPVEVWDAVELLQERLDVGDERCERADGFACGRAWVAFDAASDALAMKRSR